ncbi:MAG TPA: 16S rRNA (cytosine(1402)-N(4))-methyltransferase RsmH [Candidatus Acidoferrum sp.]|nr:16S rRNA (cytosine(1402)-N(4))-methyltransferase RsmH [Candidatus Acidoferrum sp.]
MALRSDSGQASGEREETSARPHIPVLLEEVLEWLRIKPDGIYVDATLGAGGHSAAIAARLSQGKGRLISLDRDARALQIAQERLKEFGSLVSFVHSPFSKIAEAVHGLGIAMVDGVLADLGVSSMQLDRPERGFSFREAGPLDMRMSSGEAEEDTLTADEIVNRWSEKEVADLLFQEAEEHDSRRIARAIVKARPIRDTAHLATVVAGARKQWGRQRLHPATKTFLALRIAVNREMEELGQFLFRTPATLNSGGRWVMLTYHSREDRPVKRAFQEGEKAGTLSVLTKHVIVPSPEEQAANPRSRSAKLRCAEKV